MRKIGAVVAVTVAVGTLVACAPMSLAAKMTPSATGASFPDVSEMTPGGPGYVDDNSLDITQPGPVPTWDAQSRASAITAAETVMGAYARPDLSFEQWWEALQPLLDQTASQDYAYMAPARIVASSITGPGVIADETSAYVVYVDVPTNAGTYSVILSRADADSPWLASRFIVPEGVN